MSSLSVTLSRGRFLLLVAPSILVLLAGPSSMALSSMVAFPVKFRLYLPAGEVRGVVREPDREASRMPPLLLVVDVLVVVKEPGLHRGASSMPRLLLVAPALGWPLDAVLECLLLALVVVLGFPPALSVEVAWSSALAPRKAGRSLQPVP